MTENTNIKTLEDGSVDYAHYIARSHEIRSNGAHRKLAAIWGIVNTTIRAIKRALLQHTATVGWQAACCRPDCLEKRATIFRTEEDNDNTAAAADRVSAAG